MLLDRTSFKEFAGLKSNRPSATKTLWKYRDQLSKSGCMDELFGMFKDQLWARGYELTSGQIVDSSIVSVPCSATAARKIPRSKAARFRRTGSEAEQAASKRCCGTMDEERVKNYYGYKNHISADRQTKFIAHGV